MATPLTARSPWHVLTVTSLAVFVVMLDSLVLVVAFPDIERSFPAVSAAALSWVLNAYTIIYGALLAPAGRLADRIGRRRAFLLGVTLFTTASVLCGLAPSPAWLVALRIVQAAGGALLSPAALALTLAAFPPERRTLAVALNGAVGALAVVAGPPLGALIVQTVGWSGIFFLNLPIGLLALVVGWRVLAEWRESTIAWPDGLGVTLLIVGVGLLTGGLVQSEAWGWSSPAVLAMLAAGATVLGGFLRRARRVAVPVLDLALFASGPFRRANLANTLFGVAFTAMFFGSVFFLTRIWGFSLVQAGLAITPGPLMVVVGAPLAGRLASRWGHRRLLVVGGLLYAAGALVLLIGAGPTPQFLVRWLPAMVLTGLGVALIIPLLSGAAVQGLSLAQLATGSSVVQALRQFASVLGVALTVLLLGDGVLTAASFAPIFGIMLVGGLAVSAISAGLPQVVVPAREEVAVASEPVI